MSFAMTLKDASCWYNETANYSLTFWSYYLLENASKTSESYSLDKCSIIYEIDFAGVNNVEEFPVMIGIKSDYFSVAFVWGHVLYVFKWV